MIQPLTNAGQQPADIFRWRQNGYNLLLYLTTKHVFENFGWCNCPVAPLGCGPGCTPPLHGISDNGSFFTSVTASGATTMMPKRPWCLRNKLAKIFTDALNQISTIRKTSVTDNVIACPSRTNFGTAIGSSMSFSCCYLHAGFYNAFCQSE